MADEQSPKEKKPQPQPKAKEEIGTVALTPPSPTTPPAVEVEKPKTEEKPKLEVSNRVSITNKTLQKLIVNLCGKNGKMDMVEINAKSSVSWPRLDEYGPHARLLVERGHITIS